MLREQLERDDVFEFTPAPMADPATISLAHDPAYVEAFVEGKLSAGVMRRIGFPWSQELVERTLASAGGTLGATEDALGDRLERGSGAAPWLAAHIMRCMPRERDSACSTTSRSPSGNCSGMAGYGGQRSSIWTSTRAMARPRSSNGDPDVFTFSMHGAANFPFRKQESRLDIALPDGTGDDEYLGRLADALSQVLEFEPEIIYYQSGVDALASDRLGRLSLTAEGLQERDRMVLEACRDRGIPVVITLGGGYSEPIELTVEAHANTFRQAASIYRPSTLPA